MTKARISTLLTLTALLVGAGSTVACSSEPSCSPGEESCPCYDNGTCNTGLSCLSNTCVDPGGTGGDAASGGSTSGTGGDTSNTGGDTSSTGGADTGTGGAASCGDTQSDPSNCGACGHVCRMDASNCTSQNCCSAGQCPDAFGACFEQNAGFTTCNAYCASLGQSCAEDSCSGNTWIGYGAEDDDCERNQTPDSGGPAACDAPLPWNGPAGKVRCCCTDNTP